MPDACEQIGIRGIGTALPAHFAPLAALSLHSSADALRQAGFEGAYVADDSAPLALTAARAALENARVAPAEIDALLVVGALPSAHHRASAQPTGGLLDGFCYSASWLQEELELDAATVCGIAQQGCAGMFSALRAARAHLLAEPDLRHVLCIGADVLPAELGREVMYNVISDAACAVVVSRGQNVRFGWLGYAQISKGYYWDVPVRQPEIIAAYFPTARITIERALERAKLRADGIDLVIPTGVQAASWPILLRLCGIPEARLYHPRQRFGHTIAADSFLLLEEAITHGDVRPGMTVLLFAYGFGSSWCALVLEALADT